MTVFYSTWYDGSRRYSFIRWLGNSILETDISYWVVPGTIDMLEDE